MSNKGPLLPPLALCIPARNEQAELPRLFDAIDRLEYAGPVHVCILLDSCVDDSDALATDFRTRARWPVHIERRLAGPANAGRARRAAFALGLAALDDADGLLLTTDADSRPATNWLTAMAAGLARADVVVGKIIRDNLQPNTLQDRLEVYYDALHRLRRSLDPVPWEAEVTHHHAGGANLGIRADVYRALGGFAPVAGGEDARLIDDAMRAGYRVRRDAACVVHTSDRRHGRAQVGLASSLLQLDGGDAGAVRVAHPADAAWQYRMQAAARLAWTEASFDVLGAMIGLTADHVLGVARDCPNAEAFAMCVVPVVPGGTRHVILPVAEAELAVLSNERQAA